MGPQLSLELCLSHRLGMAPVSRLSVCSCPRDFSHTGHSPSALRAIVWGTADLCRLDKFFRYGVDHRDRATDSEKRISVLPFLRQRLLSAARALGRLRRLPPSLLRS